MTTDEQNAKKAHRHLSIQEMHAFDAASVSIAGVKKALPLDKKGFWVQLDTDCIFAPVQLWDKQGKMIGEGKLDTMSKEADRQANDMTEVEIEWQSREQVGPIRLFFYTIELEDDLEDGELPTSSDEEWQGEEITLKPVHFTDNVKRICNFPDDFWEKLKVDFPGVKTRNPFGPVCKDKIREMGCDSFEEYLLSHTLLLL